MCGSERKGRHILSIQNTFYLYRTYSIYREQRTQSINREHILSTEDTLLCEELLGEFVRAATVRKKR